MSDSEGNIMTAETTQREISVDEVTRFFFRALTTERERKNTGLVCERESIRYRDFPLLYVHSFRHVVGQTGEIVIYDTRTDFIPPVAGNHPKYNALWGMNYSVLVRKWPKEVETRAERGKLFREMLKVFPVVDQDKRLFLATDVKQPPYKGKVLRAFSRDLNWFCKNEPKGTFYNFSGETDVLIMETRGRNSQFDNILHANYQYQGGFLRPD